MLHHSSTLLTIIAPPLIASKVSNTKHNDIHTVDAGVKQNKRVHNFSHILYQDDAMRIKTHDAMCVARVFAIVCSLVGSSQVDSMTTMRDQQHTRETLDKINTEKPSVSNVIQCRRR